MPSPRVQPSGDVTRRRCDRWAAALLVLVLALLVHGAWEVGPTYDEHYYIAAGATYLETGDFSLNREHPPLLKLMAAAPLMFFSDVVFPDTWNRSVDFTGEFFYRLNVAQLDRNLFVARLPLCLLTVVGVWAVYRIARRLFGPIAGLVALLLCGFNPNVLAHGRLAALDMGSAVLLFLSAAALLDAVERPSARTALRAALLFGLAHLAKFTALLLIPLGVLVSTAAAIRRRSWRPLGTLLVVAFAGLGVFAAGYGFEAVTRNEAWARPPYVEAGGVDTAPDPLPAELGERLAAAHPPEAPLVGARLQRVAAARDREAALAKLAQYLAAASPELAAASYDVLAGLRTAGQASRKLAFEQLLSGELETAERRLALCCELAARDFVDLEAAEAWWGRNRGENWNDRLFSQPWLDAGLRAGFAGTRPIPLFSALRGLDYQLEHGKGGHLSYFRGKVLREEDFAEGNPHPEYYATVMAVKNPPLFLLLVAAGAVLGLAPGRGWNGLRALTFLGFPALVFLLFSTGNLLMGVKYLLPVFPFLAIVAARVAAWWPRAALVVAILAAIEGVAFQPHQLMYYNLPAGGPVGGPYVTVVGDDWGQDVRALGRYYAAHRADIDRTGGLYYEPYSVGDMHAFGLEDTHAVYGPLEGIVAVHAVDYYRRPERFRWLAEFEPYARLGWSIYLYDTRGGAPGGAGF